MYMYMYLGHKIRRKEVWKRRWHKERWKIVVTVRQRVGNLIPGISMYICVFHISILSACIYKCMSVLLSMSDCLCLVSVSECVFSIILYYILFLIVLCYVLVQGVIEIGKCGVSFYCTHYVCYRLILGSIRALVTIGSVWCIPLINNMIIIVAV